MTATPDEKAPLLPHEEPLPPRLDLYIGAVFVAFGIAVLCMALSMPTFKERLGEIYTAPGIVPGFYGTIISLLGVWLTLRAISRGALIHAIPKFTGPREGYSNVRLGLAAAICVVYAGGLISRVPFWLATALFVLTFILLFEWRTGMGIAQRSRMIAVALAIAAGASIAVVLVFERVFLVRLP